MPNASAFNPTGLRISRRRSGPRRSATNDCASSFKAKFAEVRGAIANVVRAEQAAGRIPADADPDDVAGFLFGSILGYVLQRVLADSVDPQSYAAALEALTR
jgi:hypothetical protein